MSAEDVQEAVKTVREVLKTQPEGEGVVLLSEDECLDALDALALLTEYLERLWACLNCSHNNISPDDPDNPWTYTQHDGKTWNYCPECGLMELWEGGMFFGARLAEQRQQER